ncbi:MAG TPA: histidine-type phosphatase [Mucilaginibacter sp.]|nr:histidine-type phosphatase [Mucilaginibacter sp.]
MKKVLGLILFLSCFGFTASAQNCNADFLGTKTLYKKGKQKATPAPARYVPVFINHVGRHGARHLTKDVTASFAYGLLLSKADSAGALTEKGKKLQQMVIALQKVEKGNIKSISAEGVSELQGISERMFARYSNVFKGKPNLNVMITKEIRTKQSADAFLKGLNSKLKETASINEYTDDTHLRFYDASPAYKRFEDEVDKSELTLSLQKKERLAELNNAVAGRFFKDDFLSRIDAGERSKFVTDVFGFATIVFSLDKEIKQAGFNNSDLDFKSLFSCDELSKLSLFDMVDDYLKKGPGTDNNGIQVRVAVPLLVDFINSADEYIKTGKYNACLRFAHAETTAPFATLLQISTADKVSKDISKVNAAWKCSGIIPLSSNIQWVFYKKKGTTSYLVKILLNEKEAHITGLNTRSFPYYKWSDLRALYLTKLSKLNVKLTDDMASYLTNLK